MSDSNISNLRVFNEKTGLLEYTLLGLVSAGVYNVDIYTFIPNNEVTLIYILLYSTFCVRY